MIETIPTLDKKNSFDVKEGPKHIAIIMDGNRRWAGKQKLRFDQGHRQGAAQVQNIIKAAKLAQTKILTLFAFSTENATRSKLEVSTLMRLLETQLIEGAVDLVNEGIRLSTIGDKKKLPFKIQKILNETIEMTAQGTEFDLVLALGYGGRDEICRAAKRFAQDCKQKLIEPEDLTESVFASYLDTKDWPDPDLLIRTAGEMRISNFLLWQISYSEVYITETLWPDFNSVDLEKAIDEYHNRKRRFGK